MKRDLKADLELCAKLKGIHESQRSHAQIRKLDAIKLPEMTDIASHAIERALDAEELVRELVAALQGVSGMLDYATGECRCGVCEYCNVQKRADKALAKAEEVLGDE